MHPSQVQGAVWTKQQQLFRLEALCRMLAPQQEPVDTLAALGVLNHYPFLAAHMCGHEAGPGTQHAGAAFLAYVSLLNQVVMMSTQLYNDALVPQHHKYIAHQIALLYVSWIAPTHATAGAVVCIFAMHTHGACCCIGLPLTASTHVSPQTLFCWSLTRRCVSAAIFEHAARRDQAHSAAGGGAL